MGIGELPFQDSGNAVVDRVAELGDDFVEAALQSGKPAPELGFNLVERGGESGFQSFP
jgi:hypothetical protein